MMNNPKLFSGINKAERFIHEVVLPVQVNKLKVWISEQYK